MHPRELVGLIIATIGLVIIIIGGLFTLEGFIISLVYGLPLFIIGIIILLNKNEDKIEQPNYSKLKRRGLKNGKK